MSYGQMLAAAQAFATPEQQRKVAQTQSQGADFEVKKEKKSQMEELQAMMEAELKRASNKGGFFKNLGNLGKVLGFIPGVGTLASGLIGGIAGAGQAGAQKKALKKLMKDPKFAKYKGSWLGDPTKEYLKDVKGLASDIDPLKTGLSSLATSMASGKMMEGIGDKVKGAFTDTSLDKITKQGLEDNPWLTKADEFGDIEWTGDIASLDKGPLQRLFKDFDLMDIMGEGLQGQENLQALPLFLQMFGVGGGGNVESDASSYFR